MEGRTPISDPLFMSKELDFDLDSASHDWNNLPIPLNAPYDTNDAAFADVHLDTFPDTVNTNNINSFDTYSDPNNLTLFDIQGLPALETIFPDTLPMNWDFMAMPTINDPVATTISGSITTTEVSNYSSTYTNSSSPMTESPAGPSQSQLFGSLSTKDAENASNTTTRRRRTKMEPGTRPCDLKQVVQIIFTSFIYTNTSFRRQKRKEDKPEKCHICEKGHQWKRDLERHYRSNHPDEAANMGLSRSRPICRHCGKDFARRDHLKRHLKRKHGGD
jgi:hypothetical protein